MDSRSPIYMYGRNAQLLASLAASDVRFVIVGGVAVQYHVPNRDADDLDLLIDPTERNAQLVIDAVNSGGIRWYSAAALELAKRNVQWPIKCDYYVDILTPNEHTDFDMVWQTAVDAEVAHQPLPVKVRVAGVPALIAMKAASQDPKHVRDVELLRKVLASKHSPDYPLASLLTTQAILASPILRPKLKGSP